MLLFAKIISVALSGLFVILEQNKHQRRYRSWQFWCAIAFAVIAIVVAVTDEIASTVVERKREADLTYLSLLNSPVRHICFVFVSKPHVTLKPDSLQLLFRVDRWVPAQRSTLYSDWFNLIYKDRTGWDNTWGVALECLWAPFPPRATKRHYVYWIEDFGIEKEGHYLWKPERLSDFSGIAFKLGLDRAECDVNHPVVASEAWNPVASIQCYADEIRDGSLLFTTRPWYSAQFPCDVPFNIDPADGYADSLQGTFRWNPLALRRHILRGLE